MEKTLEILYNYKPYDIPKIGLFSIHKGTWGENGWIDEEKERNIIGETDDCFITRLIQSDISEYGEDTHLVLLPIGIHKSRFIRWVAAQINLFE